MSVGADACPESVAECMYDLFFFFFRGGGVPRRPYLLGYYLHLCVPGASEWCVGFVQFMFAE